MKLLPNTIFACTFISCLTACGSGGGSNNSGAQPKQNTQPVAHASDISTSADGTYSGKLMGSDAEGDNLVFALETAPVYGTATISSAGEITYTPLLDASGLDLLTFTVMDGNLVSKPAQVSITINPVATTFSLYSRQAFNQMSSALPMHLNNRDFNMDVSEESSYADLFSEL